MIRFLFCCAIILITVASPGFSQVNTENLRKFDLKDGFYNTVSVHYGYYSGNSSFTSLKTDIRTDYIHRRFSSFLVATVHKARKDAGLFINKGFVHLRGMQEISESLTMELFLQKGFNDFILLNDRNLAGSGLRYALPFPVAGSFRTVIHIGSGIMLENERIESTNHSESTVAKSTNYLSLKSQFNDSVSLASTSYYQIALSDGQDFRILSMVKLGVTISKNIALSAEIHYAYDHDPPPGIKCADIESVNGITLTF